MKQKNLWILSGTPGSGKSTWVEQHLKPNEIWVSRDAVRFAMLNDEDEYFDKENEVFKTFVQQIQEAIYADKDVYADATHLNWKSRRKLLNALDLKDFSVGAIVFRTPLYVCIERNNLREGRSKVPMDRVRTMYYSMTDPATDPFKYSEVKYIFPNGSEFVWNQESG